MTCFGLNIKLCMACSINKGRVKSADDAICDIEYLNMVFSRYSDEDIKRFLINALGTSGDYWIVKAVELCFPEYKDMLEKLLVLMP